MRILFGFTFLFLPTWVFAYPKLNLSDFRLHSLQQMKSIIDEPIVEDGIWFQDHFFPASDLTQPPECSAGSTDYASISFALKVDSMGPYADLRLVHTFWLHGLSDTFLVYPHQGHLIFNSYNSFLFKVKESVPQEVLDKVLQKAQALWPGLQVSRIGFGIWWANFDSTTTQFRAALNYFYNASEVEYVELDQLSYLKPDHIDLPKQIGLGTESPSMTIEPEAYRTISKIYREKNYLNTLPELPEPFGKGWTPRDIGECPAKK